MTSESILMIIAPLFIFVVGVLLIPYTNRYRVNKTSNAYKLIDEIEKKYIY